MNHDYVPTGWTTNLDGWPSRPTAPAMLLELVTRLRANGAIAIGHWDHHQIQGTAYEANGQMFLWVVENEGSTDV